MGSFALAGREQPRRLSSLLAVPALDVEVQLVNEVTGTSWPGPVHAIGFLPSGSLGLERLLGRKPRGQHVSRLPVKPWGRTVGACLGTVLWTARFCECVQCRPALRGHLLPQLCATSQRLPCRPCWTPSPVCVHGHCGQCWVREGRPWPCYVHRGHTDQARLSTLLPRDGLRPLLRTHSRRCHAIWFRGAVLFHLCPSLPSAVSAHAPVYKSPGMMCQDNYNVLCFKKALALCCWGNKGRADTAPGAGGSF